SSSFSACCYPLLDIGLPQLLPICTIYCHLLPIFSCCFSNFGNVVSPSIWWSSRRSFSRQFTMVLVQRSSVILAMCPVQFHFNDAIRSMTSTTFVCCRIH